MDWLNLAFFIAVIIGASMTKNWKQYGIFIGIYLVLHAAIGLWTLPSEYFGQWMVRAVIVVAITAGFRSGFKSGEEDSEEEEEGES